MKTPSTSKFIAIAMISFIAAAPIARAALVTNVLTADGYIRGGGILTNVPSATQTATNTGIMEVKSGSSLGTGGGTRKAFFKFTLAPNVNTNANMVFSFVISGSPQSQAQRIILWGLNQPYPSFSASTLTWSNAQANSTIDSNLLTSGAFTATLLSISNFIERAVSPDTNRSVTLQGGGIGGWGHVFQPSDNTVTLAMTGLNDGLSANSPIRIVTNSATVSYYTITAGNPPTISSVSDFSMVNNGQFSITNSVTVGDVDESAGNLVMSATSSDGDVVASHIVFTGSGASRSFYITNNPASPLPAGSTRVVITATDSAGNPAQANFKLTVIQAAPTIIGSSTNTLANTPVGLKFSVYELGYTGPLSVTAISGNTNLVLDTGIVLSGSGSNSLATVTPIATSNGIAPIIIVASDTNVPPNFTTNRFCVMVLPSTNVVFADNFDYIITDPTGFDSISTDSGDFWFSRAGAGGTKVKVSAGVCVLNFGPNVQSVIAPLKGGPYEPGSGAVFLTKFKATWTAAPASPDSGNIVALYDELAGGTSGLRGRLSTTNSAGGFRARVQDAEGGAYVEFPQDLTVSTPYTIWLKYDVDGAQTKLWVDPVNEASPSVTNLDTAGGRPVYDVSLRQGTDTGPVLIDDLSVTITNRPVIAPHITSIVNTGAVVIRFTGDVIEASTAFTVLHSTNVAGPYSNSGGGATTVAPGSFQAVINDTSPVRFYRIQRY